MDNPIFHEENYNNDELDATENYIREDLGVVNETKNPNADLGERMYFYCNVIIIGKFKIPEIIFVFEIPTYLCDIFSDYII